MFAQTESLIIAAVMWLKLMVESVGAGVIAWGIILALAGLVRLIRTPDPDGFLQVRMGLARYLALALEFQLAADILSTAVAPSWQQIGQLGSIAVIRTGLNFFLQREMGGGHR